MNSWLQPSLFDVRDARPWPFAAPNAASDTLTPQAYRLIMIDPPWHFKLHSDATGAAKSPQAHYDCMSLEEIAALPVGDLAAPDCLLWLWATAPMLDQQIRMLAAWGFDFCTSGVWVKTTVNDKLSFGAGYVLRSAHEPFIIGTRGSPRISSRSVRSVIMDNSVIVAQAREHSRKPDAAYVAARALIPDGRACDVFARERRSGWACWGREVGKFGADGLAPSCNSDQRDAA